MTAVSAHCECLPDVHTYTWYPAADAATHSADSIKKRR